MAGSKNFSDAYVGQHLTQMQSEQLKPINPYNLCNIFLQFTRHCSMPHAACLLDSSWFQASYHITWDLLIGQTLIQTHLFSTCEPHAGPEASACGEQHQDRQLAVQ